MEDDVLPRILSSLDTLLCLHYASSTATPSLHSLCSKASHLTKRRVDHMVVERLLGYDPQLYRVLHVGGASEYGLGVPAGMSVARFGASIPGRRERLARLVLEAGQARQIGGMGLAALVERSEGLGPEPGRSEPLPLSETALSTSPRSPRSPISLASAPSPLKSSSNSINGKSSSTASSAKRSTSAPFSSPSKLSKSPAASPSEKLLETSRLVPLTPTRKAQQASTSPELPSPTKLRHTSPTKVAKWSQILANSAKKFHLKTKPVQSAGSLLERIKEKERLRNRDNDLSTPQKLYRARIMSKLPSLYDVIYELASAEDPRKPPPRSYSLPQLVSVVRDSFALDTSEQEIEDAIRGLVSALPERLLLHTRGAIRVLRVSQLSRNDDLAVIANAVNMI